MNKKLLSVVLLVLFALSCFPLVAGAADGTIDTDGTYDIGAYGNDSTITIDSLASTDGLTVTLTNTSGATFTNLRINCVDAGTKLTIDGVKIDNHATSGAYALSFSGAGNTLTLAGVSSLISGSSEPGVRVEGTTELTISGGGELSATGGNYSAGIGAGKNSNGGSITITSGTITANGGYGGAGIGGGQGEITSLSNWPIVTTSGGNNGEVKITGGAVTANGGTEGAGIGGGDMGEGGKITIEGGTVTAAGYGGAGIGGGAAEPYVSDPYVVTVGNSDGGEITISGGVITASSGYGASVLGPGAGIGGGFGGDGGTILISGGTITASSNTSDGIAWGGAGIGGGGWGAGGVITIEDGTITASGSYAGAGIGGGGKFVMSGFHLFDNGNGEGGTITIEGGTVVATSGTYAAGIGGGGEIYNKTGAGGGAVVISGGVVYAEGDASANAYDIGPGNNATAGAVTISGTTSVFLRYDNCLPPILPVPHSHKTTTDSYEPMEVIFGTIYGIAGTGVSPWADALGGYFLLTQRIIYNANSGEGRVPNSVQVADTAITVKYSTGISKDYYLFTFWNTAADGSGTKYLPLDIVTLTSPSLTLYAQWVPDPPTGDSAASQLLLFAVLALLSLAGIVVLVYTRVKQKSR